ncbi:hypothetical protein [Ferdinandcohnia sp. Marseille-Q9671]
MFGEFVKSLFERGNIIRFELDDWYKWYKEPQKFHRAVVLHLEKEGKQVETISITNTVTSNKISILLIDGVKYELNVAVNQPNLGPTQSVVLKKIIEE